MRSKMKAKRFVCVILAVMVLLVNAPERSVLGQGGVGNEANYSVSHDYLGYGLTSAMAIAVAFTPPPVAIVISLIVIGSDMIDQN